MLTNIPERVEVTAMGRLGTSDHTMLSIQVEIGSRAETTADMVPNWRKANWTAMKERISAKSTSYLDEMETEEVGLEFSKFTASLVKEFVPLRLRRKNNKPVWMTRDILRALRRKRKLWK